MSPSIITKVDRARSLNQGHLMILPPSLVWLALLLSTFVLEEMLSVVSVCSAWLCPQHQYYTHLMYHVVNNNFLFLKTHIEDLTLNSNVTCDLRSNDLIPCIRIQDGITLDCNGYSIIGPGTIGDTAGIEFGNNVIIKNCNVEHFPIGIDLSFREGEGSGTPSRSGTVESTTVSKNNVGIEQLGGFLTLKNVLVENNRVGLHLFTVEEAPEVAIDNAYFCNNSDQDISFGFGDEICPGFDATGQIFASTIESRFLSCPIEDVINESLEENGFGPIKSCTDLVAQQALLSDM